MQEKILIKKESYLNIQKSESDGKVSINITVEPVRNKFKPGDIVFEDGRIMIVKEYPNLFHCLVYQRIDDEVMYNGRYCDAFGFDFDCSGFRYATEEEKNTMFELLKKEGKRWNAEKLCIEDIPERKFKVWDKVRIKDGISSKTHRWNGTHFSEQMDDLIGKILTVKKYNIRDSVCLEESIYEFSEEWLEPVGELKAGDWVIAWNEVGKEVISKLQSVKDGESWYLVGDRWYNNAIKWDKNSGQLEKIRIGIYETRRS